MNSATGPQPQLKAPAAICIILRPGTAGEVLKVKSIVVLPFITVAESAGIPFTVRSLALTVIGSTAPFMLRLKSVGGVVTILPQPAVLTEQHGWGVGVGAGVPPTDGSLSVNASCCETPLMATRPSVHEVRCLPAIAEA